MANIYKEITLETTTSPLLDLTIKNGDFAITESSQQETNLILNVFKGNYFQFPTLGVGIISLIGGSTPSLQIEAEIESQMVQDGFIVDSINIQGSGPFQTQINIEAHRP